MKISHVLSIAVLAGPWSAPAAMAQAPADAVMLVPGVYTTPEISEKCGAYARSKTAAHEDQRRQTLALACAQKLWNAQIKKK